MYIEYIDLRPLRKFVQEKLDEDHCGNFILRQGERMDPSDLPLFVKLVLDEFDLQREER